MGNPQILSQLLRCRTGTPTFPDVYNKIRNSGNAFYENFRFFVRIVTNVIIAFQYFILHSSFLAVS
ncbi:unnamed protein product [Brugia timori]|uniref:Uncharacterized protein n=1 Tax=Brugia timori TaxID=42155 RepID=A0A3P7SR02_9BILA|nr:unnamed protein product [Brugia timori]